MTSKAKQLREDVLVMLVVVGRAGGFFADQCFGSEVGVDLDVGDRGLGVVEAVGEVVGGGVACA